MANYKFEFDDTKAGDARYNRKDYETLHEALRLLESRLSTWNQIAMTHGAIEPPYKLEVECLKGIIEWGDERLSHNESLEIFVRGISVGSLRLQKAALIHAAWYCEKEVAETAKDTWPGAVAEAVRGRIRRYHELAEHISLPPATILDELRPDYGMHKPQQNTDANWDAFVSHASEDKDAFARPLAEALRAQGLSIWFDEFTLTIGDSLRRSIDRGLARSKFGVVILSRTFFEKEWPQKELDGLAAREVDGEKVILPVWHGIDAKEIRRFSPMLADRVAISSGNGITAVVNALIEAMQKKV